MTYRLYEVLDRKLKEIPELSGILHNIEMPVARVLTTMEENGIELDLSFLYQLSVDFAETIQNIENQIIEIAGESFNVGSPKQVGEVLFEKLGLKGGKKTATGQYSTSEAVLEKMVAGRIEKFYKENCLLEQVFIKDGDKTVTDIINESIAKIGENINVRRFVRYGLGEGIEKRQDDFVAEVMASVGK